MFRAETGFLAGRVQVLHLELHDVHDLLFRDLANLLLIWLFRAGSNPRRFFQQHGRRRRLGNESKRFVLVNGDNDRNHHARLVLGCCVKLFAKRHDIHSLLAERGTYGWRGVGLAGGNLQFNLSYNFFSHCFGLILIVKRSTGVPSRALDRSSGRWSNASSNFTLFQLASTRVPPAYFGRKY